MKEFSEIIQKRRNHHLVIRAARNLENRNSYELTDDLGINSDSMPSNNRLKHQPAFIILNHLEVGIEQPDQPGVHNTGTSVQISPMISLDSVMDTIQRSHHDVGRNNVSLSNYWSVHNFGSKGFPFSLCPLADLRCGLPTDMMLQKEKPTRFAKNNPKGIILLVHIENLAL
jgi:hypothetical protein